MNLRAVAGSVPAGAAQVAVNEIHFAGGEVLIPLPGERYARDLTDPEGDPGVTINCAFTYFCVYSGTNYSGTRTVYSYCQFVVKPGTGLGSFYNNQPGGTVARFKNADGNAIHYSQAPDGETVFDWTPVASIELAGALSRPLA